MIKESKSQRVKESKKNQIPSRRCTIDWGKIFMSGNASMRSVYWSLRETPEDSPRDGYTVSFRASKNLNRSNSRPQYSCHWDLLNVPHTEIGIYGLSDFNHDKSLPFIYTQHPFIYNIQVLSELMNAKHKTNGSFFISSIQEPPLRDITVHTSVDLASLKSCKEQRTVLQIIHPIFDLRKVVFRRRFIWIMW